MSGDLTVVEVNRTHGESRLVRKSLSEAQRERLGKFVENPIYGVAVDTLKKVDGLSELGLYGGFGLVIGVENLKDKGLLDVFGWFDERKCGDADFMVGGLVGVGVDKVRAFLEEAYRESGLKEVEVKLAGDDSYPRVEVYVGGREVVSVADLGASVKFVREIRKACGMESGEGGEWSEYMSGQKLMNMKAIIFGVDGEGVLEQEGSNLEFEANFQAIATVENCRHLYGSGKQDLGRAILREIAGWNGRMVLLPSIGQGFGTVSRGVHDTACQEMDYLRDMARIDSEGAGVARKYLAERVARAVEADMVYTLKNMAILGTLRPFSQKLAKEVGGCYFDEDISRWARLRDFAYGTGDGGRGVTGINEFLLLVGVGLGLSDKGFMAVIGELEENWVSRQNSALSGWGRERGFDRSIDFARVRSVWEEGKLGAPIELPKASFVERMKAIEELVADVRERLAEYNK